MNQVWLNGRLASDPEGGESGQGVVYSTFTVAVEKGSGDNKQTTFLDCVAFRQQADFIRQYFNKGDSINVVGSINVRDWTDANGIKHRKFEVVASQVGFPVSGKGRSGNSNSRSQGSPRNGRAPVGASAGASGPEHWDNQY